MTVLHRTSVSAGEGTDFVISDGSLDRHGTRINPKGWDLNSFKRNPIALFGHSGGFPIGRWENVRVEGAKLIGTLLLAAEGTSDRIDELRRLVEQGILRAVSVGFSVLEFGTPGKSDYDFEKQELHEVSLVSVPSNTNALAKARSLNISESTLRMAFGEHAEPGRTAVSPGGNAARPPKIERPSAMKTLSQRIEDAQTAFVTSRDAYQAHVGIEDYDIEQATAFKDEMNAREARLNSLKEAEAQLGIEAQRQPPAPPVVRRPLGLGQREVSGLDLFVRAAVVNGIAQFGQTGKTVSQIAEERYPGHEATKVMCRADQTIGTTTVSGWASEIVQTAYADFLQALMPYSVYPALRSRGIGLSFDGIGTVSIPSRTAGGAGGGFVAEGVDGHHHQRRLHAHHRSVAAVHAFDLAGDQAVADVVQARAAVLGRDGGAQQAQLTHLAEDGRVGLLVAKGQRHAGQQLALRVVARGVLDHALFLRELVVQQQRVGPVEGGFVGAHLVSRFGCLMRVACVGVQRGSADCRSRHRILPVADLGRRSEKVTMRGAL